MLAFRLRTSNKQSSGLYHVDIPDIVRPYGDNGLWATSRTTNQLIIFPLASPDGITWNDIKLDEKFIISEIKDQSVLNVSKSGNWFLNFLNNGTTVVTLKVKDPDGSGNILLTKQFTVEVNNPDFVRFNKVSLKVLQNASTVSGVDSVSLLLEYTTYEVDASGKRTGKTAKGNWSDQWSKSSTTKTASIPLSENWYFDNKVHVVLRSRMTKAGAWMTSKQGYVEISDGKLQLKIVGSALKTLDLDGSASGYASFIG